MIVGDIGGTKTQLAHLEAAVGSSQALPSLQHRKRYQNDEHDCFEAILSSYLMEHGLEKPDIVVLAVAGPVVNNRCRLTNLPWDILPETLEKEFGIANVYLINDLAATAHSMPFLPNTDFFWLQGSKVDVTEPQCVISAGTGLGEATLVYARDQRRYVVVPGEGGHKNFAPSNEEEMALLTYYLRKGGPVSNEMLISGKGLQRIYEFLKQHPDWEGQVPDMKDADNSKNMNQLITQLAFELPDSIYAHTVSMFAKMLMSEAGNQALQNYSNGGVVLAGGIPPVIKVFLQAEESLAAFHHKSQFSQWLKGVPIRICLNTHAPLYGAWAFGQQKQSVLRG
ncbi:MAG: glucokinase [Ketobacteraceae bacterium]|nr:glucokinase [Ketobacteraceae bacterium]